MTSSPETQSAWAHRMSITDQLSVTKRIFRFATKYWKQFLIAIILSTVSVAAGVIMPRIIQYYIDNHLAELSLTLQNSITFVLIYGSLLLIQASANFFSAYHFNMASEKTVESIRNTLFHKINTLGMRFFDQTPAGSIVSRITNDTETLKEFWRVFYAIFEGTVTIVIVFFGMVTLNIRMALMFLLFVPIMVLIIWIYQSYSSVVYRNMRENLSRLNTKISESVSGISIIQNFRQEKRVFDEFSQQNNAHFENRRTMVKMNALLLMSVISLLEGFALALVIFFLGRQYFEGFLEVGVIYAFTQYSVQFFRPMGMMMDSLSLLQDGIVASSRILRYLDNPDYIPHQNVNPLAKIDQAKVEFKNLSFSYDGVNKVLDDISFSVNPGETVAIVGHTGSGKSSIINVLMRFYEFQEGDVLIDGYSIREFPYKEMRRNIGLVLQDSFLFYGDVSRNIRLLEQSITDDTIREATHFVHADTFIENQSEGYSHRVIERGAAYSSGQKQLISFARTMARKPKLLILDEATANIDTQTESYIQSSLANMRKGRTSIAIAHRLSTIRDAHQIIVLDKGKIIEKGTHEELIEKGGNYYQMYQLQSMS